LACNQVVVCGTIVEIGSLRYTPAGIAVNEFKISHLSRQIEAGRPRQVECEIAAVALGQTAEVISRITAGTAVKLAGFLAKKNRMGSQLVLHVNSIDVI